MNLLSFEAREVQEKQRLENLTLIQKFQEKLKFSIISFIFFIIITMCLIFNPTLYTGIVLPILSSLVSLFFVQQIIRSYNYREFHKNNYKFMEGAYKAIEEIVD